MSTRFLNVCIAAISIVASAACSKNDPPRQPKVPVSVTTVRRASVPYVVTANGVAEPMQTVAVESQVNGILQRVKFSEVQAVTTRQALFQIDPILVRFSVPHSQFPDIQRYYRSGNALQVRATASEGSGVPLDGSLAFVDNNVDSTTGTVLLKARFSNPEATIWPGQYMSVALQLYGDPNALPLPAPAALTGQQWTYVFTIDTTGTATQQPVQVSRTVDTLAIIASGLRARERVVVDGQSRLVPGSKVAIKGSAAMTAR